MEAGNPTIPVLQAGPVLCFNFRTAPVVVFIYYIQLHCPQSRLWQSKCTTSENQNYFFKKKKIPRKVNLSQRRKLFISFILSDNFSKWLMKSGQRRPYEWTQSRYNGTWLIITCLILGFVVDNKISFASMYCNRLLWIFRSSDSNLKQFFSEISPI